jgi:hypothetical protein
MLGLFRLRLWVIGLVMMSVCSTPGDAALDNPLEGIQLAKHHFRAGDLVRARQVIAKVALTLQYPTCGDGQVQDSPFMYLAFPPKDALHVYLSDAARMTYFDFSGSQPKRVWQMGLGSGKPNKRIYGDNVFIRQFFWTAQEVLYECGQRPGAVGRLIQFQNVAPPGFTRGGILTASGFKITVTHEYDAGNQPENQTPNRTGWYEFSDYVVKVPGEQ